MSQHSSLNKARTRIAALRHSSRTVLDLSGLGLRSFPPELQEANQLQILYASNNQFVRLPLYLQNLPLRKLFLGHNCLSTFPTVISKLALLAELDLSRNLLQLIPAWVGGLGLLEDLNLSGNALTRVPSSFGSLAELRTLDLSNNRLIDLPDTLVRLGRLVDLHLDGNPSLALPCGIERGCPSKILAYLAGSRSLANGSNGIVASATASDPPNGGGNHCAFRVFLSYNRQDVGHAVRLIKRVRELGVNAWFDLEQPVGRDWLSQVDEGLRSAAVVWVLLGPGGAGPVQKEEISKARLLRIRRCTPVVPVLLPGAEPNCLEETSLETLGAVDLRGGISEGSLRRLLDTVPTL